MDERGQHGMSILQSELEVIRVFFCPLVCALPLGPVATKCVFRAGSIYFL